MADALASGVILGRDFRVLRPLASGGMGAVYAVEQISTGAMRALKVMHAPLAKDERSRERFLQEARVGARIPSEHVVSVLSAGIDEPTGIPYLVMELLEGSDLGAYAAARGALPVVEVREIFSQLCHALGAAHRIGVVHRDLKPENVFLVHRRSASLSGVPRVKVLDFGIAKVFEENRMAGTVSSPIGSPVWMAPEQVEVGMKIGPSADVWPLGLIAFRLLTGRIYWSAANAEPLRLSSVLREAMLDPIVPASVRAAELGAKTLPPGFDAWFARCVARDAADRFANATEAFDALAPVLGGPKAKPVDPPRAPRVSLGMLALGAGLALLAIVAIVVPIVQLLTKEPNERTTPARAVDASLE